jgi:signal transduction histidine kinase
MESAVLLERLAAHRAFTTVPRAQLEWLVAVGHERTIEPGEALIPSSGPVEGLYIVLDGHLSIRVDRGAGPRIVMEWRGGDVTGLLPYSRLKTPPGEVVAEERTRLVTVDAADLRRMTQECYELTTVLVHLMLDRARVFKSSELLDEKMASLGRLAAGLAHELNNPASAVARTAKTLLNELDALDAAARRLWSLGLSEAQCLALAAWRDEHASAATSLSPLEIADRRDAIDGWLSEHAIDGVDDAPLAESGLQPSDLEELGALVGRDRLEPVLAHVASGRSARQLAAEIDTAAMRIHALVDAVKGFTHLNQPATPQPIAIERGLADAVTVLRSKAKSRSVDVAVQVAQDLPAVDGYGGELNQVWANLIDNAIDAAPGGHVRIVAAAEGATVVVRVIDDGPGIPADVATRIFDPFFTTKEIGQGTGLGLDIARRIVQRHRGVIDMGTGPGGTEFRVTLPVSTSATRTAAPMEAPQ